MSMKAWLDRVRSNSMMTTQLLTVVVALSISNLVFGIMAMQNKERVVLVPPHMNEKMSVAWSSADAAYLKSTALYAAIFLGNVSPGNADFLADGTSLIFSPSLYREMREEVFRAIEQVKLSGRSLTFMPNKIEFEPESGTIFVLGAQKSKGVQGGESELSYCYEFRVSVINGLPQVTHYDHYEGLPHNLIWQAKEQARLEAEKRAAEARAKHGS